MNIKRCLFGILTVALLCIGTAANAAITGVQPDKNIGVYKTNQTASFVITRDDTSANESFTYTVENINETVIRRGSIKAKANSSQTTVKLGNFIPGWYRLRVYGQGNTEIGIFASFTVVEEIENKLDSTPFSTMLFGFTGLDTAKIADYTEALGAVGFDTVRDGTSWAHSVQSSISKTVDPLTENGLKTLLTYELPQNVDGHANLTIEDTKINGNLYKTHSMLRNQSMNYPQVAVWEIINEPDLQNSFTADAFSSYYKAAALGIEGGNPMALKSFGGLAGSTSDFSELMMQNRVADFTDSLDAHLHNAAKDTVQTISFDASRIKKLKNLAAIYGHNQPLWNTEAGLSSPIDSNNVISDEYLKIQAKYAITSVVQSIAEYGTGNHFWFISRNYLENGRNWGTTSPENCTYPAFYSMAMLIRGLGEGTPIGELAGRSANISGYFFDAGENDAAVLWNNSVTKSYQQLKSDKPVKVKNLIGGTESVYGTVRNVVNIPVTSDPVIVIFDGRSDSRNYVKKTFTSTYERDIERTVGDKVVMQAVWTDSLEIANGRYVLIPGTTYSINLKVYNFNDEPVSGTVTLTPDSAVEVLGNASQSFTVPARTEGEFAVLNYSIRVKSDAIDQFRGNFSFSGTANGSAATDTVCGYVVEHILTRSNIGTITNFSAINLWKNGNMTLGSGSVIGSSFTFTPNSGSTASSWFPVLNTTIPTSSSGLVFDVNATSVGYHTKMQINVYVEGGSYCAKLANLETGVQTFIVPWKKFDIQDGKDIPNGIDLSKITKVEVGFQTRSDDQVRYSISNAGTFEMSGAAQVEEEDGISFAGVENNGVYKEGYRNNNLTINGEFDNIYLNYEAFDGYYTSEDGVYIDLSALEPGAYSVIVTKNGDFGKIDYKEITFCIKAADEYSADATFY
ncbi:MAG: hypothetical protein K5768_00540 [Firmicutes bacterium]|nr:hypothetical protein [Bacillota bacterium]